VALGPTYYKSSTTKWWDGYKGQRNVIIDEFDGQIGIVHLLKWMDRYPQLVEIKGGATPLRATHFWITSNKPMSDWYVGTNVSGAQLLALERRVSVTMMNEVWVAPARVRCLNEAVREVIEVSDSD